MKRSFIAAINSWIVYDAALCANDRRLRVLHSVQYTKFVHLYTDETHLEIPDISEF